MIDFVRMRELMKNEERLRWAVIRQEARATRITTTISDMPKGQPANSREEVMIELAERRETYHALCEELKKRRAQLKPQIRKLKNRTQREAIRMRYMRGMSVNEISSELGYCTRQTYNLLAAGESLINQGLMARKQHRNIS